MNLLDNLAVQDFVIIAIIAGGVFLLVDGLWSIFSRARKR
jgi:hypothetical protein